VRCGRVREVPGVRILTCIVLTPKRPKNPMSFLRKDRSVVLCQYIFWFFFPRREHEVYSKYTTVFQRHQTNHIRANKDDVPRSSEITCDEIDVY